jgi:hypothetical protein
MGPLKLERYGEEILAVIDGTGEAYDEARGRAEDLLDESAPRGGRQWQRDELHDR